MTKKHFRLIAENFLQTKPIYDKYNPEVYYQWENDVEHMADVCDYFNSRFNRAKFLEACGCKD